MRGALSGGAVDVDCGEEERVILLGHFYYNDTVCGCVKLLLSSGGFFCFRPREE